MVSNVIVNELVRSANNLGLVKGQTVFAEQGVGNQNVVISSTGAASDKDLGFVRSVPVNVLTSGWPANDGYSKSERICAAIVAMLGGVFTYNNGHETETYEFMSAYVRNPTTMLSAKGKTVFTANVVITFKVSTT